MYGNGHYLDLRYDRNPQTLVVNSPRVVMGLDIAMEGERVCSSPDSQAPRLTSEIGVAALAYTVPTVSLSGMVEQNGRGQKVEPDRRPCAPHVYGPLVLSEDPNSTCICTDKATYYLKVAVAGSPITYTSTYRKGEDVRLNSEPRVP
ncbi:predicted protein [Plenodomus lingam JN3]|uniref:Predicted protein n=1 Tax=Leptosphaeria maculans (strain JN3 / isolate v23.1.3 / race Av1-4-5-6-7-8) TaxID=985895 RepID=E4ZMW7_LEPMJ|nr:predicted protein [Plenodomus lingam JN3]CBX92570.1 predicted protein [Plenodomus lingam JN3]